MENLLTIVKCLFEDQVIYNLITITSQRSTWNTPSFWTGSSNPKWNLRNGKKLVPKFLRLSKNWKSSSPFCKALNSFHCAERKKTVLIFFIKEIWKTLLASLQGIVHQWRHDYGREETFVLKAWQRGSKMYKCMWRHCWTAH